MTHYELTLRIFNLMQLAGLPVELIDPSENEGDSFSWTINTSDALGWGYACFDEITKDNIEILEKCVNDLNEVGKDVVQYAFLLFASRTSNNAPPQIAWKRHVPKKAWGILWGDSV